RPEWRIRAPCRRSARKRAQPARAPKVDLARVTGRRAGVVSSPQRGNAYEHRAARALEFRFAVADSSLPAGATVRSPNRGSRGVSRRGHGREALSMPKAVPAVIVAVGQAVVARGITAGIIKAFVINVALSGFEVLDENGQRWIALKEGESAVTSFSLGDLRER